jgi:uncharacterized sporulation protein YeaH/YhbH (DUF444 family)
VPKHFFVQSHHLGGGVLAASAGACTVSTADLIGQSAALRALIDEYDEHGIPVPKQLHRDLVDLAKRIAISHRAEQEAKLRSLEQEIERLRSNEEKKAAKEAEAEELRAALGR